MRPRSRVEYPSRDLDHRVVNDPVVNIDQEDHHTVSDHEVITNSSTKYIGTPNFLD